MRANAYNCILPRTEKGKHPTMVDLAKIKNLGLWPSTREEIKSTVSKYLGAMPKSAVEPQVKVVDELQTPGYLRRRINYFVDDWSRVSAWLCLPEGKEEVPALLCCHPRVPQGKDQTVGLEGDGALAFAHRYAEMGYITLAPDCVNAGERTSPGREAFDTTNHYKDHPRLPVMGKMLADHMRALSILTETKRVDGARLGVIGHGLGGANALLLAAFDERIQTCVASCAFSRFADDPKAERWIDDDGFALWPTLAGDLEKGTLPFDWEHILALAAPNPTMLLTALNDDVLAKTKSCGKAVKLARRIYKLLGEEQALENVEHRQGRTLNEDLLVRADEWFERWL